MKVLMLHGYAQNANIFSKHLEALRKSVGKDIELVFVDGPIVIHPVDLGGSTSTSIATLEESEADATDATSSDPPATVRAWFRTNRQVTAVQGVEASLLYLRDIIQRDRYDGVFGFSQGGSMASLLSALLERPHTYPPFLINGKAPHPPFKFCVCASGFKIPGSLSTEIFGTSYSTPTLHVIGRNDIIIIEEWSKVLVDFSQNKRVEEHVGGHFVPLRGKWREIFRDYLVNPLGRSPESKLLPCRDSAAITYPLRRSPASKLLPCRNSAAITCLKPIGIKQWHPRTRLKLVYTLVSNSKPDTYV